MKKCRALYLIALASLQLLHAGAAAPSDLWVSISGFPNSGGVARISLYNAEKGFPDNPEYAFRTAVAAIADGSAEIIFPQIPAGLYAVSAYHDENKNNRLDKRFGGLPAEAVGASRYDRPSGGKPVFSGASFPVYTPVCRIPLVLFLAGR